MAATSGRLYARDDQLFGPRAQFMSNSDPRHQIPGDWGWFPLLACTSGIGLIILAFANNAARAAMEWSDPLFWLGLLVIFLPIAARLLFSTRATREERIGLLLVAGLALYLAKYLEAPLAFGLYDEYLHWRTAQDIATTQHLFTLNPILPVSSAFPGLEIATNALSSMSGLSIFASGLLIVGIGRIILMLALYMLFELVLGSKRLAGAAVLVYLANPHMLFFDAAYSYESLALPLVALVLFTIARHMRQRVGNQAGLTLVIVAGLGAVVVTHHLTSYILVVFLLFWAVLMVLRRREAGISQAVYWALPLGAVLCVAWFMYAGGSISHYLAPHVTDIWDQISGLITGTSSTREFFHDYSGWQTPLWEQIVAIGSVALIVLTLPFGWYPIWRARSTVSPLLLTLVLVSLLYLVTLPLRLTQQGAEIGDRATAFVFMGIAMVLAIGVERLLLVRAVRFFHGAAMVAWMAVIFVGGIVSGAGPTWNRMPGPYLPAADGRSITPEGIDAAQWAKTHLGAQNRFATDRVDDILLSTYGGQFTIVSLGYGLQISDMFTDEQLSTVDRALLLTGAIQYIEVDQRLSTGLPRFGYYFNLGEPNAMRYTQPISANALDKFDGASGINRIFDSGNIAIYNAGVITNAS